MKIAFVLDDTLDKTDGVQQYVTTVGEHLRGRGHDVHYLVPTTTRTDLQNIHSLGRFISTRFNDNNVRTPLPASTKDIKQVLDKEDFDVVHVQMPYSPFLASRVINQVADKVAVIGTFHILPASKLFGYSNSLLAKVIKKSLKRFDQIVSVSKPAGVFAKKHYGIDSIVVPNAVTLAKFISGKKRDDLSDGKKNIVFLGRFVKRKGVWQLIDAIHAFFAFHPELKDKVRFVLCGDGPLRQKIEQKVINMEQKAHIPKDSIIFTGRISEQDKPGYLASADIAIFPSISGESFGIVLIEAIASGSGVVVGGNNPGYYSVLQDEVLAIVDPNVPEAISERLFELLKDDVLRNTIAENQRKMIERFDVSVVVDQLLEIYSETLKKRGKI